MNPKGRTSAKRFLIMLIGVFLAAFGCALVKVSNLGADPFTTFLFGIIGRTGLRYSAIFVMINGVLLISAFFLSRHLVGIATVCNLFGVGVVVETTIRVFGLLLPSPGMAARFLILLAGILTLSLGCSLTYTADLGVPAYDSVALIAAEKTPIPFRVCRIGCDVFCAATGFLLGCMPGVGTVIVALCLGPVIHFFNVHIAEPLLSPC